MVRQRPLELVKVLGPDDAPELLQAIAGRETGSTIYADVPLSDSPSAQLILNHCRAPSLRTVL